MKITKNSKDLILFFSKNKHLNNSRQTKETQQILISLYNNMIEAYNYIKSNNIIFTPVLKNISKSEHIIKPRMFNSKSFPETIRNHIDDFTMTEISYSFSLYDRKIKVYFLIEKSLTDLNIEVYNTYMEMICIWLYILNMYASNKCSKTFTVYFYLTSQQKKIPSSNIHILNETHVNTAFTTTCPVVSEIVVYRNEEWFKVFIHETFHNFGLDFSMMDNELITNCILNIYKVKSSVNAYEAYAEFWAEIMNALFCSFVSTKHKDDMKEFLSNANFYINYERTYSFFQLTKILDFMGLTYKELYSNLKYTHVIRENLYKENTNVLSYYILKTILLGNYQGFLSWCKINNQTILDFKKTPENQIQFCNFIKKNYKTQSVLNSIYESTAFLSKIKKSNFKNNFVLSNLRMSICELG